MIDDQLKHDDLIKFDCFVDAMNQDIRYSNQSAEDPIPLAAVMVDSN